LAARSSSNAIRDKEQCRASRIAEFRSAYFNGPSALRHPLGDRVEGCPRPSGRGDAFALHKHFARADVDQVCKRLAARLVGNHRDVSDGAGAPAPAIRKADPRPYRDWAAITHRGAARKQSLQ